jgi:single-stranded-DNA-specific exonuclease
MPPEKRWEIYPEISPEAEQELSEYSPVLRQILYNRGFKTRSSAQEFLTAQSPAGTEPENMLGISNAVERLDYALNHSEPIAIYGDYDADGVTATALLVQFLRHLGANVEGYIPNRFDEGYGVNIEALDSLKERGFRLVITVDCGIRSPIEAEHARQIGLDLIITDHHHPLGDVPDCLAVVNPKQLGDTYPDKDLAGVGLAYKLASGYLNHIQDKHIITASLPPIVDFLDLVALGTISDLAPLRGENRSLVKNGLQVIRQPSRQGLASLIGISGLTAKNITASDISFILGPRLNAAGRVETAVTALDLLLESKVEKAGFLAQLLENNNRTRQEETREALALAEKLAHPEEDGQYLLFASDPGFSTGIVGLVASRLTEAYYRPSVVANQGPEFTRASCRSIPEFHITDALDVCADLMEHHGGHAAAAGFTVRNEHWPELIERLKMIAEAKLSTIDLQPSLKADIVLPFVDLKPEILADIEQLQPTGMTNPQPVFCSQGLKVNRYRTVGKDNAHLRITLSDDYITYDAIGFRLGNWADKMPSFVDIMYYFELNEFNGNVNLQLNLRDIRPV